MQFRTRHSRAWAAADATLQNVAATRPNLATVLWQVGICAAFAAGLNSDIRFNATVNSESGALTRLRNVVVTEPDQMPYLIRYTWRLMKNCCLRHNHFSPNTRTDARHITREESKAPVDITKDMITAHGKRERRI
jgi:hypothetical protein